MAVSSAPKMDSARAAPTAAVVAIGDELLSGKVRDTNVAFLVDELRELGVPLVAVAIVRDDVAAIAESVRWHAERAAVVLTTGGVGPTHDDVTLEGIARAFDLRLARSRELESLVRTYYRGPLPDIALRMADVPEGSELIAAEGLIGPVVRCRNVYILPGLPELLEQKFRAIRERFRQTPFRVRRIYFRVDEPAIAEALARTAVRHGGVAIGSYPRWKRSDYQVLVTLESKDEGTLAAAVRDLHAATRPEDIVREE